MQNYTLHPVTIADVGYIVRRSTHGSSVAYSAWEPTQPGRHAIVEQFDGRPYGEITSRIAESTDSAIDANKKFARSVIALAFPAL